MDIKTDKKLRIWESALLLALCLALCAGTWAQARHSAISGNLVRLHVIAHSDAPEEQQLKLRVRDAVLEYLEPRLEEAENSKDARRILSENLEALALAAAEAAEGRGVTVTLGRESYPTRHYESLSLPGGVYESLRVTLGEGKGQNWWCVVFPPLCTGTVTEKMQAVMSAEDMAIITQSGEHRIAFRTLELWGELKSRLAQKN